MGIVGQHVELLLLFALNVDGTGRTQHVGQPGAPHVLGDDLRR
jgi:hypothetical protein